MNFRRLGLGLVFAATLAHSLATAGLAHTARPGVAPPPALPESPVARTAPAAAPARRRGHRPRQGRRRRRNRLAESPEPPQFDTLDGTWEIEVQPLVAALGQLFAHEHHRDRRLDADRLLDHGVGKRYVACTDDRHVRRAPDLDDACSCPTAARRRSTATSRTSTTWSASSRRTPKDPGTAFTGQHRKK